MRNRTKKWTAWFFLIVFGIETFVPGMAYALTSGPAQPELTKFEPAGTNDMVDLFTGNFKYNIPLVDVGGYPINLSYQSGEGMEDEASWVGFGWTLNPGTINREMRGLPDDFNGDKVEKTYDRKDFKKIGGEVILKPSIFGWEIGIGGGSASVKIGVYKDNYYGAGASFGLGANQQLAESKKTTLTAGLNISADNREGATLSPSFSLSRCHDYSRDETIRGLSGSLAYNTRAGLKQIDLGATWSIGKKRLNWATFNFAAQKYFGQTYTPTFNTNTNNSGYTFNFDVGFTAWGGYQGIGGSGYYYQEKIAQKKVSVPAYGYMNYLKGRKNPNALIDFNRENDGPYVPGTPAIPVPVPTFDLFVATGQAGSQQFRPFFNGNYVVFDRGHYNYTLNASAGATIGFGNLHNDGGRVDFTSGDASTQKWISNNDFLQDGEPEFDVVNDPFAEAVNFKTTGEIARVDNGYMQNIQGDKTVQVVTNDKKHMFGNAKTWRALKVKDGAEVSTINSPLKKSNRDRRTTLISYLNAGDAKQYALDKKINGEERVNDTRLSHHLSEITVTDNGGQRMVYGIPVYNTTQREASFSINKPNGSNLERALKTGLIEYKPGIDNSTSNTQGRDNSFSRDVVPAYATAFLLTGILSPDYIDLGNDGITDDDLGTAYKFAYARAATNFKWRAPYATNTANYNQGFESDEKDDKASYTYGEKELWYLDTVESKTMIAIFVKSDREDGLGVKGEDGGKDESIRLKKLDRIELYSKADWVKDKDHAIPVKVVHFEYDYSTHRNVPNNTGKSIDKDGKDVNDPASDANVNKDKGKLTLKRVYFTFGNNKRGQSNPYDFSYQQNTVLDVLGSTVNAPLTSYQDPIDPASNTNPEASNSYTTRQEDRWGTYKPSWYNHLTGIRATDGKMTNSEFPYAIQENDNGNSAFDERKLADLFASMWQLNKIITPTGSTINVDYETDEYGYVQNQRAMQMCMVKGVGNTTNAVGMMGADGFTVELPRPATSQADFKQKYLNGADGNELSNIYYKIYTDIDNKSHYEYVQGYAQIKSSGCLLIDPYTAFIAVEPVSGTNPVAKAAWQMMKSDLPQLAYDNYDNSDVSFTKGAIKSLIQSVVNMKEFVQSFDGRAKNRHFADRIDLAKSMIRLYSPENKKMGGGARVKQLTIEDAWHDMSHNTGKTAKYGQLYEYSGGVASYEPQIGNEENPFHQPVPWTEKVNWAPDKYHFVDLPFCETFFPAPSVGYGKVTVTNFGDDYAQGAPLEKVTGYIENEFYTAKEFPTFVDYMPLQATEYENNMLLKLFSFTYVKRVTTSQGFKIELNDMDGKPKSVKIFNKAGDEISSIETFYNVDDDKAAEKHLNNNVDLVESNSGGKIETDYMGMDIDLATDVRESDNESFGVGIGAYFGTFFAAFAPVPYVAIKPSLNFSKNTYHSISQVKVVHKYGIVKKVVTRKNGSSIEAENVLWDAETGAVLLTKTQNEFNDYTYSFNYPAYWAEGQEGMGGAYKNIGIIVEDFRTPPSNIIPDKYKNIVFPGDELIGNGDRKWVIKTDDGLLRIVDGEGNPVLSRTVYAIARSGRRNMMGASAGSIVCLNNPVAGTGANRKLQFNVGNKILDAKAVLYSNEWGVAVPDKQLPVPQCDPFLAANVFSIDDQSRIVCNGDFRATGTRPSVTRSYMKLCSLTDLPVGTTILSATLKLYPIEMQGSNSVIFSRVKETVDCTTEGLSWASQPAVSGNYQVITSNIPLTTDPYVVDVTGMVNDWYTSKDNPDFGIAMQEQSNGSILTSKVTSFYGAYADHLGKAPSLEICYLKQVCFDPVGQRINPYVKGVLGNWRPKQNFVYMVDREQKPGLSTLPGGTNIRTNGAYNTFNPFWEFRPLGGIYSNVQVEQSLPAERWVWSSKSIYYDQKGNEIESVAPVNRDPQGNIDVSNNGYRYSAALYGYRESAAIAVATNARHNEIAFDGFEDYYFTLQKDLKESCPTKRHFDWGLTNQGSNWCAGGACLATDKAHSGKYSLKLNGAVTIDKPIGNAAPPASLLSYNNSNGTAVLAANELALGFSPLGGSKQYIASLWVYDGKPDVNTVSGLNVQINSQSVDLSKPVPVVEGWKQLTIPFTAGSSFLFQLSGSAVYIDDVRVFPYDANMTSFVYDDRTMRLTAQLDENNFATFYEYDDEGTPIRVKKETERGIMTLKENRQSFRQR